MSVWTDALASIKSRLNTEWALLHPTIPVVWPNDPRPALNALTDSVLHAEVSGASERIVAFGGLGTNLYRRGADLTMTLYSPALSGEEALRLLAADAAGIFRGWRSGAVRFHTVSEGQGGAIDRDGAWFSIQLFAFFDCDFTA